MGLQPVLATVVILVASACTGDVPTTTPPSSTARPLVATREPTPSQNPTLGTFAFVADLNSSTEIPPITDAEAACNGQGRFVLRARLDSAGKITSATAQFSFFVRSCPDDTQLTLVHIHHAPAGQNGTLRIDSGLTPRDALAVQRGEIGFNVENVAVDAATVPDLIADPARYYFDVHSARHADGLLRGQLAYER